MIDIFEKDFQMRKAIKDILNENTVLTDNFSRQRLIRVHTGLIHLIDHVVPQVADEDTSLKLYAFLDEMRIITSCEQCDMEHGK
ncbi:Uncharacterised protein [Yersinia pseudotuberculosis]|nr:hypothetical protein YPSE1_16850 [Yersinia pseudotuberculosis]CNK59415.1 Uncharacterised protein [Yersinia pseudotuberculosis]